MKNLWISVWLFWNGSMLAQSLPIRYYTSNDGLTSNIVYDAIQDDKGFMWFPTNSGLSRFDGQEWKSYYINDGLGDNEILKVKSDLKGRLWLFGFNGSVNIVENGNILGEKNSDILSKIKKGFYYKSFYPNAKDEVWLTTRRQSYYKLEYPKSIVELGPFPVENTTIFETQKGLVNLNIKNTYLLPKEAVKGTCQLDSINLLAWHIEKDSIMMAVGHDCILKVNKNGQHELFEIDLKGNINIIDLYFLDENQLWIVADKNGVYHYEKSGKRYHVKEKILTEQYVTSTFIDAEGNHWFTTYGGGVFFLPFNYNAIVNYNEKDGLKENEVFSVFNDNKGILWIGHKYQSLDLIKNKKTITSTSLGKNETVGRIGKILSHPSGKTLVSSDEGFFITAFTNKILYSRVKFEFPVNRFLPNQPVKDFVIDSKGNIVVASQENIHIIGNHRIQDKDIIGLRLNLKEKRIFSIAVDDEDNIWFSNSDGLNLYYDDKVLRIDEQNPLLKNRIMDMEWVNGNLYMAVDGHGIVVLRNRKVVEQITEKDGLLSNNCSRLFKYGKEVYLCSNKGLNVIRFDKKGQVNIESIFISPVQFGNQINDVFVDSVSIYVATLNGVTVIPKSGIKQDHKGRPEIYFTEILYKDKDIKSKSDFSLDFNDRHITFKFTLPTYFYPDGLIYQYQLNDNPWQPIRSPQVELNELRPGIYRLKVRGKKFNSDWSREAEYRFRVERPFYLSWWFYGFISLGIGVALFTFIKMKFRRIKQEEAVKLNYEQEINKLQLKALQAMINPHFVFNSLSAIQQQINAGDNQKANAYLTRFSKLLRKNLETINENFVTVAEEIARIKLYLETEKMRLGEKLQYDIEIDPALGINHLILPTMIVQPLVENAIWHGILPSDNPGYLLLKFTFDDENLYIDIKDNGIGYFNSQKQKQASKYEHKHMGMKITEERLKYLEQKSNKKHSLIIHNPGTEDQFGTWITLVFPLIEDA